MCRDVAQPGRALAWGARGRQFKSARPDHLFIQFYYTFSATAARDCRPRSTPTMRLSRSGGASIRSARGARHSRALGSSNLPVPTIYSFSAITPSPPPQPETAGPRSTSTMRLSRSGGASNPVCRGVRGTAEPPAVQICPFLVPTIYSFSSITPSPPPQPETAGREAPQPCASAAAETHQSGLRGVRGTAEPSAVQIRLSPDHLRTETYRRTRIPTDRNRGEIAETQAIYRSRRSSASNSSLYAYVNLPMVNARFRPLGLGNTQTVDPPSVVVCKPHERSRWFRNTEHAGFPRNATYLGL